MGVAASGFLATHGQWQYAYFPPDGQIQITSAG